MATREQEEDLGFGMSKTMLSHPFGGFFLYPISTFENTENFRRERDGISWSDEVSLNLHLKYRRQPCEIEQPLLTPYVLGSFARYR